MNVINVGVVDDQQLVREALVALIKDSPNLKVPLTASNGKEALDKLQRHPVDVLLMDIEMPAPNGIETAAKVHEKFPDVKIIALSIHENEALISKMFESGACGYLSKNVSNKELLGAIGSVMNSGFYFTDKISKALANHIHSTSSATSVLNPLHDLSKQELKVLMLICQEMNSDEIADHLSISVHTVNNHRQRLKTKIGAKNTAGLVLFAIKHDLAPVI